MQLLVWIIFATFVVTIVGWLFWRRNERNRIPAILRPGNSLAKFRAVDERGQSLNSEDITGTPAVLIFVRGSWCPFCTAQVEQLTNYYKEIIGLGARLILVTPKPLETTRRVADFFKVDFEFWLDESLTIADTLGIRDISAVPDDFQTEYGGDTVWPTSIIVDAKGIIRYTELSRHVIDRPDPKNLLKALRKIC